MNDREIYDSIISTYGGLEAALEPVSFPEERTDEKQLFLTPWQMILKRFMRNRLAIIGLALLLAIAILCFIIPLFYEFSETEMFYVDKVTGEEIRTFESERITDSLLGSLQKPDKNHILGTNQMGQDMLARLMYGGRVSLMVGFVVVGVELVLGILLGGIAGYYGGFISTIIMRLVDIVSSVPDVALLLVVSMWLVALNVSPQYKIYYTMFIIGAIYWTSIARIVRGNILSLRESEFMQAATATGIKVRHKIFKHLIPNTLPSIIVAATLDLGKIILLESTLSFLGVGVGAPYASWGNMVQSVNDNVIMRDFPNIWAAPGICILITVLAFNFVGDGLRDATDPKMKR